MESPVHNERCTPGSEGGARRRPGASREPRRAPTLHACVAAGLADPDHPEEFERRNIITRALGIEPAVEVDARLVDVAPGDTLLLCSDGLSGPVPHRELADILLQHPDLDEAVARLVDRANELGGPDNITAVAVRWEMTERLSGVHDRE